MDDFPRYGQLISIQIKTTSDSVLDKIKHIYIKLFLTCQDVEQFRYSNVDMTILYNSMIFLLKCYLIPTFDLQMRAGLLGSYCTDRSASWCSMREALCGTLNARNSLLYGNTEICEQVRYKRYYFHPTTPAGLNAISPKYGYSGVYVPGTSLFSIYMPPF